jgi:uncharacterized tellurite resistance protein B-like protein
MQDNPTHLYDAFGELLYVVAMADGFIQESEISALERVLADNPWAAEIKWSFNYERKKQSSPEEAYKKVIDYCQQVGPKAAYKDMLEVMEAIATASNGVDQAEQKVMDSFIHTLTHRFKEDLKLR